MNLYRRNSMRPRTVEERATRIRGATQQAVARLTGAEPVTTDGRPVEVHYIAPGAKVVEL